MATQVLLQVVISAIVSGFMLGFSFRVGWLLADRLRNVKIVFKRKK